MALTKLKNLITDVPGITVGNAADHTRMTGVSVVLPDRPAVAAVDVRGGAPGTRETDLLTPSCMVDRIDAICLSGGSVFGLQAADAVVDWLAARHRGFAVGPWHMPIVPAAIIFDLMIGEVEQNDGGRPYRALAEQACDAAGAAFSLGNAGAGMGARAGKLKGGLGSASAASEDGMIVGALAVANPVGAVTMPGTDTFWAWALERNGELGHQSPPATAPEYADGIPAEARVGSNTTLAVVATNVALDKAQAQRVAIMAHDGFARAIRPVHTPFDGDTAFVLSTGERATGDAPAMTVARVGAMAADCVARAIARGVYEAEGVDGAPGYRENRKPAVG